jgi:uncharacterized protein (DUF58 family)
MATPTQPVSEVPGRDDRASGGAGVELHPAELHPAELHPAELHPADLAQARLLKLRASKLVANAVAGAYRSSFLGSGIEFEEVRPYQPGDDVRTIDWKVTARTREPHIKTYREERQLRVFCVVDVAPSMDFGSRDVGQRRRRSSEREAQDPVNLPATKRRMAARLAALIAAAASTEKDAVGLELFAAQPLLHLDPEARRDQSLRFYREVLGARTAGSGRGGLGRALQHLAGRLRRHALLFVISDFHDVLQADGKSRDAWEAPLGHLSERHDVHCIRVVDPLERELPKGLGRLALTDLDSGRIVEIDAGSARHRAAWSDLERRREEAFVQGCRRARAHALTLAANAPDPAVALVGHLQSVARRGGRR